MAHEAPSTEMWGIYDYQGHRVTVIQQWEDPFGRRMVRVQVNGPDEAPGAGMLEADFVRDAVLVSMAGEAGGP